MTAFTLQPVATAAIEAWVDGLREGDVVLHARRGAPGERRSLRFRDPRSVWRLEAGGDVHALLAALEAAVAGGQAIAGYLAYEAGAALVGLPASAPPPYALAWFGAYDRAEVIAPQRGGTPLAPPRHPLGTLGPAALEVDAAGWAKRVAAVRAALAAGDSYQVNLTTALRCRVGDVRQGYRALSASQPVPFGALLDTGELSIASLSPELLVRSQRAHGVQRLTVRPMKGTAPRRPDAEDDLRAAAALRADPKSRAENVMIVDLLRNDLGRLARPGTVAVTDLFALERYRSVWQLTSTVTAEARPDVGLAALLGALFPCGSVSGAPKRRTMELIAALEDAPRGVYTGAIGFALPGGGRGAATAVDDPTPTSVWSVAIRTLAVQGQDGRLGVGGGIVIDSDPAAEFAELAAKGRFLTDPRPTPTPFETMRWEGGALRRWPLHRARLTRAAAALDLPFDGRAAHGAVAAEAARTGPAAPAGVLRVRLALHEDGGFQVDARPHVDEGPGPVRVGWSTVPIRADDAARRHKTDDRAAYDAASAWARAAGLADVLFVNEEGRVAEGAISNVFVRAHDGRWRTPPVRDGALPGVLREELLARGEAVEAPLWPADLARGDDVAIGSALRGLRLVTVDASSTWPPGGADTA